MNFTLGASGSDDWVAGRERLQVLLGEPDEARAIARRGPAAACANEMVTRRRERIGDAVGVSGSRLPRDVQSVRRHAEANEVLGHLRGAHFTDSCTLGQLSVPFDSSVAPRCPRTSMRDGFDGLGDARRLDDDARGVEREVVAVEVVGDDELARVVRETSALARLAIGPASARPRPGSTVLQARLISGITDTRTGASGMPPQTRGPSTTVPSTSASCPSCGG